MHPDLSPHLHTEQCNKCIQEFKNCHIEHPIRKFVGYCNSEYDKMIACMKQERLERRRRNGEKAKVLREKGMKVFQQEQLKK